MLDRTTPPPRHPITLPHLPWPEQQHLKPGVPLWVLQAGTQPVARLELIFDAGTCHEAQPGVAYCTAQMLLEGTQRRTAQAVAQCIDQYGATLTMDVQPDTCTITLTTLTKHWAPMLALLAEVLSSPAFEADRLAHVKHLKIQALKVEEEKNSYVAQKRFKEALFAPPHPYGSSLTANDVAAVTLRHVRQHYDQCYYANCRVLLSGCADQTTISTLQQHLQHLPVRTAAAPPMPAPTAAEAYVRIPQPDRLQAAICTGKVLFAKDHPDYLPMLCVNALLGGFFGARLMRNIREQKGYTYGIYSRIVTLQHTSYLQITTEVIQQFAQATCDEIVHEVTTLQTVPVPPAELDLLRNYLLGTFLAEIDDPFSAMDKFREAHLHGLDQTHYAQLHQTICRLQADQIMALAQQYLDADSLRTVVVG